MNPSTARPPASPRHEFVLTLSGPDTKGIVYAVSGLLYQAGCNILDSQQFGDVAGDDASGLFFMRVHFEAPAHLADAATLRGLFTAVREQYRLEVDFFDLAAKPRVMLMVSRYGHCLNDLLFRWRTGGLGGACGVDIPVVVSNHPDFADLVQGYGIPFVHLPLPPKATAEAKAAQEAQVLNLVREHRIDLVVLARYMQILSQDLCQQLAGRAINIHHSFLPSFKGARPYAQAHERGVKLIGATAHYVTADLDEGPIIEQDVERVDHSLDADDFARVGRDVECVVLARAVRWHVEHRVLLNKPAEGRPGGLKTVVFRQG